MSARVVQRGRIANETTPSRPSVASVAAGSAPVKEAAAMPSSQARARNARIMSLCDGYERRNVGEDGLRDDVARQEVFDGCEGAIGGARLDDALRPDLADAGKRLEFRLARGVDVDEGSLAGAGNGAAAQRRDEDVVFVLGASREVDAVEIGFGGRSAGGLEGVDPAVAVVYGVDAGVLDGAGDVDSDVRGDTLVLTDLEFFGVAQAVVEEVGDAAEKGHGEQGDDEPAVAFEPVRQARGTPVE